MDSIAGVAPMPVRSSNAGSMLGRCGKSRLIALRVGSGGPSTRFVVLPARDWRNLGSRVLGSHHFSDPKRSNGIR